MPTRTKKKVAEEQTTYLIERSNETLRLTVPSSWKVTFGPFSAGKKGSYDSYSGGQGWTLRFYESTDKQRAVFSNVHGFRDLSLPLEKLVKEKTKTKDAFESDKKTKTHEQVDITQKWVSPDVEDDIVF